MPGTYILSGPQDQTSPHVSNQPDHMLWYLQHNFTKFSEYCFHFDMTYKNYLMLMSFVWSYPSQGCDSTGFSIRQFQPAISR